jgi:hypothetical protein
MHDGEMHEGGREEVRERDATKLAYHPLGLRAPNMFASLW